MNSINSQPFFNASNLNRAQDASARTNQRPASSKTASAEETSAPSRADLMAAIENQNRASSVAEITSVDLADAATQFTKQNFHAQPDVATQAQANLSPESVRRLLQS